MQWYGHASKKEDEHVIMKSLKFEVRGRKGGGDPKNLEKQLKNEMKKNELVKENACNGTKWRGVVKSMTI